MNVTAITVFAHFVYFQAKNKKYRSIEDIDAPFLAESRATIIDGYLKVV